LHDPTGSPFGLTRVVNDLGRERFDDEIRLFRALRR
jgi:hypothetical protein